MATKEFLKLTNRWDYIMDRPLVENHSSPSKELDAQKGGDLSDKLLPCPFCNGIPQVEDQVDMHDFGDCRITCTACMARSDVYTDEDGDRIARAKSAWNTRALPLSIGLYKVMDDAFKNKDDELEKLAKQLTATQQALDEANADLAASEISYKEWVVKHTEMYAENRRLQQALDSAVAALNSLVGSDGCVGWIIGHDTIKDALLIRGGRLPIESFHPNFQVSLREVIEAAQKAKAALASISGKEEA